MGLRCSVSLAPVSIVSEGDVIAEAPDADVRQAVGANVPHTPRSGIPYWTDLSDLPVPDPLGEQRTGHDEVVQQSLGRSGQEKERRRKGGGRLGLPTP